MSTKEETMNLVERFERMQYDESFKSAEEQALEKAGIIADQVCHIVNTLASYLDARDLDTVRIVDWSDVVTSANQCIAQLESLRKVAETRDRAE